MIPTHNTSFVSKLATLEKTGSSLGTSKYWEWHGGEATTTLIDDQKKCTLRDVDVVNISFIYIILCE